MTARPRRCDRTAFRIGPAGVASSLGVRRLQDADLAEVTDRRATWWHITPSSAGGVVELETRSTYHGKPVLVCDAHLLAVVP